MTRQVMDASMTRTFGGYLPLEPDTPGPGWSPAGQPYSSGRACLAAVLREMRPARLHLPGFLCDSVFLPARELGVDLRPYPVDLQLLPPPLELEEQDMVLYVDYFGLCTQAVHALAKSQGERAIVDRSQAWFSPVPEGSWSFDSARKFFGVPDGGLLCGPRDLPPAEVRNTRYTLDHLVLGRIGDAGEGLDAHRRNNVLMHTGPERISLVGERLLQHLDLTTARTARTHNFHALHAHFSARNRLVIDATEVDAPLYYPLLLEGPVDLQAIHAAGIFAPRLWPDVLKRPGSLASDKRLVEQLLPLPIDQRYTEADMNELAWRLDRLI